MFKKTITLISLVLFVNIAQAQIPTKEDMELRRRALDLVKAGKTGESLEIIKKIPNQNVRNSTGLDYVDGLFSLGQKKQGFEFADKFLGALRAEGRYLEKDSEYSNYALYYSSILVNHKEFQRAYEIMAPILKDDPKIRYNTQETYIKALAGVSKYREAYQEISRAVTGGRATSCVADTLLAEVCLNLGYDQKSSLKKKDSLMGIFQQHLKEEVKKARVQKPAPDFTLKDFKGNTVSLKDFQGKTVILDFWANWCSPCKETFPIMQKAVSHYKNNPDVVFLFIDTFERNTADPVGESMKYMADNHFEFNVLFDVKRKEDKDFVAAKAYNVKAIPTKCIIDRGGNIVFFSEGGINYYHSDLYSFSHLAAMIDSALSGDI